MSDKIFHIIGRIIDRESREGLPGLRVEAWDKDLIRDDFLGNAVTDDQGAFNIEFSESYFRELFLDRQPDLYFKVYFEKKLIKSTEDSVLWNVSAEKTEIEIEVEVDLSSGEEDILSVGGRVMQADGTLVESIIVKAFDKDLRREQVLGETTTDNEGRYRIRYTTRKLSRPDKNAADLIVRAYNQEGTEVSTSSLILAAAADQTVDLIIGNETYLGPSEYVRLQTGLKPLLYDVNPAELTDEEITYLAGKTGFDPIHIGYFVRSAQLEQKTDIQSEIFYGLFRQNLPTEWEALLLQDLDVLCHALKAVVTDNIISARFSAEEQIEQFLERWKQLIVEHAFEEPDGEDKTSLGALLGTTIEDTERQKEFVTLYVNHEGPINTFWSDLRENPDFKDHVDDLQFTLQLGMLTKIHLPLVNEIQRMKREQLPVKRDQSINTLRDLTLFNEDDWKQIINNEDIGFPSGVPGDSDEEKAQNYANAMTRMMEDAFPTAFVANRIAEDEIIGRGDLLTFFDNNEEFAFTSTRLETYLSENDTALNGIEDKEALKNNIKCMQRLYKVAPNYESMRVLMKDGLDSAHAITCMGPTTFTAKYGEELANKQIDPGHVYERSEQVSATALILLSKYGMAPTKVSFNAVPDESPQQVAGIPDWQTLFGALELCECEHCRSVYSPAAYLVDVLYFLKNRRLVDQITRDKKTNRITKVTYKTKTLPNNKKVDKSTKDALFERRPDIGTIELTCKNTNTPVPYVDLVNEVLENRVAPFQQFKPFKLSTSFESDLEKRTLSSNLVKAFTPSLSKHALITVMKKGDWWTINDLAFTYTIRKESGQLCVKSRSLQTIGTAQELAANPQYVNRNAYDKLKQKVFPLSLPFNLWMEEARAYLGHLGVQRYELMETFLKADIKKIRADLLTNKNIAYEYLGITVEEANLINGTTTGQTGATYPGKWNLWGFSKETLNKQNPIPDPADSTKWIDTGHWLKDVLAKRVDVFLQQSGIKYIELLELLGTHYINPFKNGSRKIHIVSTDSNNESTCELAKLELSGFGKADAFKTLRFIRLWQKLGWTICDLDKVITALKPIDIDDDFLKQLSHIKRLNAELDAPIPTILSFWAEIDTAVYIDHSATGQPKIPSLYEQLFRNKTVINPLDSAFTEDPKKLKGKLSGHIPTIIAGLGISAADFTLLVNAKTIPDDNLNLDNLSMLYRHAALAKTLNLTIRNYLSVLKLMGSKASYPFTTTIETVLFVERVGRVRNSGFTIAELDYLFRHKIDASAGVASTDNKIALILGEIRSGLQIITAENTFIDDPKNPSGVTTDLNGDLTRKKLSLLNWDNDVIEQATAMLNRVAIYEAPLTALATGIKFPDSLKRRVSYDSNRKKLRFVGFMTAAEKALLLKIDKADAAFKAAVETIAKIPGKFISRHMRTFSVTTFEAPLKTLPSKVTFPDALKNKVYYDATAKKMYFIGAMTASEQTLLLGLSTDASYQTAIENLFKAPETLKPQSENRFLTVSGANNDADELFENLSTPGERFEYLLKKLMPYLCNLLSERLVKQKLGEALKLEAEVVDKLLTKYVNSPGQPTQKCITDFLEDAFVKSNLKVKLSKKVFQRQFNTFTLLHKIALIITNFEITSKQAKWILEYGTDVDWLDLNALPLTLSSASASLFKSWERLVDLFQLRDGLPLGETVLDSLFKIARTVKPTSSTADKDTAKTNYIAALAKALKWNEKDLESLLGQKNDCMKKGTLNVSFPEDYQDERTPTRLLSCFKMLKRLGMSAEKSSALTTPGLKLETARDVIQAVKAKYSDKQWLKIARPLRDVLREKQRAALVAYLVTHPSTIKKSGGANQPAWRNVNGLYAYFLIDVEMSPCQMTSRIKQAISSTQLFVQRCLMNLESDVNASVEIDVIWRQWKWMKNYRVWEANRKVFLYPENWIEPELRDDKSPFFKELESELLQNEITKDTAETVFLHYLEKLDAVDRLEIVGMYRQWETDDRTLTGKKQVDILHVFGRTINTPHIYYYRQYVDSSYWTAWERVDVDIEGNHLIPVIWNRRLCIFWPIFTEKQKEKPVKMPGEGEELKEGKKYWEIQMAWSEYKNGKWSAKQITSTTAQSMLTPDSKKKDKGKSQHIFRAKVYGEKLQIWYEWFERKVLYIGSKVKDVTKDYKLVKFCFAVLNGEVSVSYELVWGVSPPKGTKPTGMMFVEKPESALFLPHTSTQKEVVALSKTPGNPFRVLYPHQDEELTGERPFFFQDNTRTFFIIPQTERIDLYQSPSKGADFLEGETKILNDALKKYLDKPKVVPGPQPIFPELGGLIVDPRDPLVFEQSFPVMTDLQTQMNTIDADSLSSSITPAEVRASASPDPESNTTISRLGRTPGTDAEVRSLAVSNYGAGFSNSSYSSDTIIGWIVKKRYLFQMFYHPYVSTFIRHLNRDGIDGLLQRPVQLQVNHFFDDKKTGYAPTEIVAKGVLTKGEKYYPKYPKEDVDFSYGGAYSQYNWELFFHAPLLIADRLSKNQRFEEAQKWFHYIFDPTDASGYDAPQCFWRTKHFFKTTDKQYQQESIVNLLRFLAKRGDAKELAKLTSEQIKELEKLEYQVKEWRKKPFKPHLIARLRTTAYQKTVVMKYLDNLIAWGDQLFRRDTIESINEATQLYILAAEILGKKPDIVPPRAIPEVQTFDTLEPRLGAFSNALVQIEEFVLPSASTGTFPKSIQPPLPKMLYFCVPKNDELLGYWDTVADRLFKIRHGMNIEGVVRQLPLFAPPIEPGLLVKAAAAGIDISSALNDINAALPHYRFNVMLQKAFEICNDLKALGSALLSALEKRDAEALTLLRSTHEINVLNAVRQVKLKQIEEAKETWGGLKLGKAVIKKRRDFYKNRLDITEADKEISESSPPPSTHLSDKEQEQIDKLEAARILQIVQAVLQYIAAGFNYVPDLKVGAPTTSGYRIGGTKMGAAIRDIASGLGSTAAILSTEGQMSGIMAGHERREEEWRHQFNLAIKEIKQIDKQIAAAKIRKAIAERELKNHDLQVKNAKQVDAYMRDKFTNKALYDWMIGQISTIYFQSYQFAYDVAKRAERAYRHELGLQDSSFVQFGYWDSLKKGLLAGEKLHHDLKRMDMAYLEQNKREYEITKHISMAKLDPIALVMLKEKGVCYVNLPEAIFDLDYPGHYMRRIKSVALTIPCVTGPYTSVNCTLTLLSSRVRKDTSGKYKYKGTEDDRFQHNFGAIQSIATSSAQNDSGLFELNFRDERYLPFEGSGVISQWRLELPNKFRQFDYDTISDVIFHINYTARDGGSTFKGKVSSAIQGELKKMILGDDRKGLMQIFSAKHEFSSEWHRFLNPAKSATIQKLELDLDNKRFPIMFKDKTIVIESASLFLKLKYDVKYDDNEPLEYDLKKDKNTEITVEKRKKFKKAVDGKGYEINELLQAIPFQNKDKEPGIRSFEITTIPKSLYLKDAKNRLNAKAIEDLLVVLQYSVE